MDYDLTLGERLDVVIGERRCVSNVQDITREGTLIISAPTFRSVSVPIPDGELINLVYFRQSGMFSFVAAVRRHFDDGNIPLCEIEVKSPISKYQRRDFVRYDTVLPIRVCILASAETLSEMSVEETLRRIFDRRYMGMPREEDFPREDCLTLDISGGGLRFSARGRYEKNSLLECTIAFESEGNVTVDALVMRVEESSSGLPWRVGVQFVNVEERLRRKIIRFIFNEQVKERQRV